MLNSIVFWLTIKPRMALLQRQFPEVRIYPAGSRYVCSPPVISTDVDFLVYTKKSIDQKLEAIGFKKSQSENYRKTEDHDDFWAWRRREVNLIVTSSANYAETFDTATHICKRFNVRDKWERICLHEALRKGVNTHRVHNGEVYELVGSLIGPYGVPLRKAYRAQHNLELIS